MVPRFVERDGVSYHAVGVPTHGCEKGLEQGAEKAVEQPAAAGCSLALQAVENKHRQECLCHPCRAF